MTVNHIHWGGGCEAIVDQVGNELNDWDVHIYYCQNEPEYIVTLNFGKELKMCQFHADRQRENWGISSVREFINEDTLNMGDRDW